MVALLFERGFKAELVGSEKVGEIETFKIKLTNPENNITFYYIDKKNYYLVQTSSSMDFGGESITTTSTFSDFRKTEIGTIVPFTSIVSFGKSTIYVKTIKIEYNKNYDCKIFEKGNLSF